MYTFVLQNSHSKIKSKLMHSLSVCAESGLRNVYHEVVGFRYVLTSKKHVHFFYYSFS